MLTLEGEGEVLAIKEVGEVLAVEKNGEGAGLFDKTPWIIFGKTVF